ncbi:FtsX-like permease family protein [Flagellimonas meridianipacifica]|uniref:Putative ABC transport system permease protein n=1 Tax=Flagellimonas meridianipacifica TaxID=1080225 RepID=A0A2T0MGZ9_9FLAO|nr:FtsX-like permease family protein [Allomuricauda pacifica]PRX56834.1 putative ABC transport system permease protein [Allomuricauda pacifica]
MLRNSFKIARRNLLKNKGFTIINVLGLGLGVAACILITLYIIHESSYDSSVANADHIYRMINRDREDGKINDGVHFSANTGSTVLNDFGEVVNAGRLNDNDLFYGAGSNEIRIEGQTSQYYEKGFTYADQAIIDIMDIQMVYGEAATALTEPFTLVISESMSKKYFGDRNPVGMSIYLNGNDSQPFRINGVMKDFASNSHMDYNFLLTLKGVEFGEGEQTRWIQNNYYTYLQLRPGTDVEAFQKKMSDRLINDYIKPAFIAGGFVLPENGEDYFSIRLQPLKDINLFSGTIDFETSKRNDIKIIWIFGIVTLFILVIASINFVNLSTAKSANRAKEVGIKKVIGSSKKALLQQFLTESLLITFIAFVIGVFLAFIILPFFQELSGKAVQIPWSSPYFFLAIVLGAFFVGILAGIYPAFYLSRFKPSSVLKGKLAIGSKSNRLRSGLVIFQFAISIILIIGTLTVNKQMSFILNSKLGFEKEQVVQLYGTNMLRDKLTTFKEELKSLNGIKNVSVSDYLPLEGTKRNGNGFVNEGRDNLDETVFGQAWVIDEDYLNTLGINLIEGRNFSEDRTSDTRTTIVNQQMIEKLNLKNPIGKRISRYGETYEIIGVVEDFHFDSMKQKVAPLCFFLGMSPSITSVKASTDDIEGLVQAIENKWSEFMPSMELRYAFMDRSFANMYDNVSRIRSIFISFAILAIFVACLGLFALSAFMVEQRRKEISIRRVLGASFRNIYKLLTVNFLSLIGIAALIATPLAWYAMSRWLEDFAYRIEVSWQILLLSAIISIIIAVLTISYQSISAAFTQPSKNLRNE